MRLKGLLTYLFLGLLIVQYQNCAPNVADLEGDSALSNISDPNDVSGGSVSVINTVEVGGVFFPQKAFQMAESSEVRDVVGVCEQDGALISWTLRTEDGLLVDRGLSECERGSFAVQLYDVDMEDCKTMNLKAALGAKASSEITVISSCDQ